MTLLALCCALAAFALFGIAADDHAQRWRTSRPTADGRRRLRLAGWLAIAASFAASVAGSGWIFGPVLWSGLAMLAAGTVFLLLNLAPAQARAPLRRETANPRKENR